MSIHSAMKVLRNKLLERLYEILTEEKDGVRQRKVVNEDKFLKLKLTTRKSWSWRSLRWLEKMPKSLRDQDATKRKTKTELKKWVRDQIPVRGCRIMWGRKLNGEAGGRQHGRIQHPDIHGDGDQDQENQQGGEEMEDEEDQEQSTQSRNNEGGGYRDVEGQGLVNSVGCRKDMWQQKCQARKQGREDYARRKRRRLRAWRSIRIKPYTAIEQLGSATGHTSSNTKTLPKGTELSSQEHKEQSPTSRAFCVLGLNSRGRGPWKPAWPPPRDRVGGLCC